MPSTTPQFQESLADRESWSTERCSIGRALDVVGPRSAMLLLREAYYGTTRFDDFAHRVGITESVAAGRLRALVAAGLLDRRPYQEPGRRTRHEYVLTESGAELVPTLLALMQWGDRHLQGAAGAPLALTHTDCGEPVSVEIRCAAGHRLAPGELSIAPGRKRPSAAPAAPGHDGA